MAEWLRTSPESPLASAASGRVGPSWFPYDPGPVFLSSVRAATRDSVLALIGPEGVLIRVTLLGSFTFSLGGGIHRLQVYRVPMGGGEPRFLAHLRDPTNGVTTHPNGRFAPLLPLGGGRFLLDLNRTFNPHCAYAAAIRCPDPWPGEPVSVPVEAGERLPADPLGTAR